MTPTDPSTGTTTTGTGIGVGGYYGTGGSGVAGGVAGVGYPGTGGFYGAGGAYIPCGPTNCPAGTQCCNPQCGLCVAVGGGCPAIACGTGGSGIAGSFGVGGGCGNPASCQGRFPPSPYCPGEAGCVCNSCACPANTCLDDFGCQQILQCALKLNCRGMACYSPQTCKGVIDQFGVGSISMNLALQLDQCRTNSGCDGRCGVGGAAGGPLGCPFPPPMIGGQCSGQYSPDGTCSEQCFDGNMNSYVAKCSGGICQCVFDGKALCSCFNGGFGGFGGGPCGSCCPGLR